MGAVEISIAKARARPSWTAMVVVVKLSVKIHPFAISKILRGALVRWFLKVCEGSDIGSKVPATLRSL
jgi:hypothetical protein